MNTWNKILRNIPVLPLLFLSIGIVGMIKPCVSQGHVPGDIGDARFNLYLLEHFFRSLCGLDKSFVDAPFFYPWPVTIGFSDTHWGTGLIYSFFRATGMDTIDAFSAWYIAGNFLNFISAYVALRMFGLRQLGAGVGAFLFAFCMPASAQIAHAQLTYRYAVPLAIFFFHRYLTTRLAIYASLMFLFLALQTLSTVYIGIFLGYLLVAWLLSWCCFLQIKKHQSVVLILKNLLPSGGKRSSNIISGVILFISLALLSLALIPNLEVSSLYKFQRSWAEIKSMLPRPQSYFLADASRLWASNASVFSILPMRWEHNMFLGLIVTISMAFAVFRDKYFHPNSVFFLMRASFFILLGITLCVFDWTLYYYIALLPGFNSIRAVTRIILVMAFPASFILGVFIDATFYRSKHSYIWRILAILLVVFCLLEAVLIKPDCDTKGNWASRIDSLESQLKNSLTRHLDTNDILVYVNPTKSSGNSWVGEEIDAMLLAQKYGMNTLNGYSGNLPNGWKVMHNENDILDVLFSEEKFRRDHHLPPIVIDPEKLIIVGSLSIDRSILFNRLREPEPYLEAGTYFSILNSRSYFLRYFLSQGWSGLETDYIWSDGKEAELDFKCKSNGKMRIVIDMEAFLPPPDYKQKVTVIANDLPIGYVYFSSDYNRKKYYFDLPDALGEIIKLKLIVANPKSPLECKMSEDSRKLGIKLYGVGMAAR
jgi:hypothetical protein